MGRPLEYNALPIADLNVADPEIWAKRAFWSAFEVLRRDDPVHFCEASAYGPYWSITKHADILQVEKNHQVFSSQSQLGGVVIHDDFALEFNGHTLEGFITMDPPRHGAQRSAVADIVARPNLAHFEGVIRSRTASLLDSLPVNETFDWVEKVSVELTAQMLATLFDFPFKDRALLTWWSNVATTEPGLGVVESTEERTKELKACLFYFTKLWRARKKGAPGSDFVAMLAHNPSTQSMNPMNFLGNILLLIVGGNDTTRNSMTGAIQAFHLYPEEWRKLQKDKAFIDNAVSEIIRWQTPIAHMRRTALEDYELGGKSIKKGDKVVMWYISANRDSSVFPNPDVFQIDRHNARQHLSFGGGIHRCMGRRLAELQLKILLEEMLNRWTRVEVVEEPAPIKSNFVHGFSQMPVRIIA